MPDDFDAMFGPPDENGARVMLDDPTWPERATTGGGWTDCVDIDVAYVDPTTERIEDDDSRNTAFRVWIEAGGWYDMSLDNNGGAPSGGWNQYNKWIGSHDVDLDCGAPDMESALLELAARVKFFYGDGRERVREISRLDACECVADADGYCAKCGFASGAR